MSEREKQVISIIDAIRIESCNTTRDVADVTGLSVATVSNYVSELVKDGILRRTGRTMPNDSASGPPYLVFEYVGPLGPPFGVGK